jgi:hypothetical protein
VRGTQSCRGHSSVPRSGCGRDRISDSHGPRGAPPTASPFLALRRVRESGAQRSTRCGAPAGVRYTALCRQRSRSDGHNAVWGSLGNGVTEKRVTATKKAVETPGGGRGRARTTEASRHRRAASRSGGATSAERDDRSMSRRIRASGSVSDSISGRIARSEQCSTLRVGDISTRGLVRYDTGGAVVSGQRGSRQGHRSPDTAIGHRRGRHGKPRRAPRRWAQGRCCQTRSSVTRVAEPVIAEKEATHRGTNRDRQNDWLRVPWAPEATHHRCAPSRAPRGSRIPGPG